MKSYFKIFTIALSPILFFNSCTDDESTLDTTKPEIMLASPTDHQEYEFGDVIDVQAIFKDNIALGSYKIDIHSDDDGHQHRSGSTTFTNKSKNTTDTTPWSYSEIGELTANKEFLLNKTIPIPEGNYTEGHYHFGIILTDKAGNETQTFIEIVIGDDHDH